MVGKPPSPWPLHVPSRYDIGAIPGCKADADEDGGGGGVGVGLSIFLQLDLLLLFLGYRFGIYICFSTFVFFSVFLTFALRLNECKKT